ncbi:hypothetical protein BGX27_011596 [Mortierella sp. AM989]|nr:hypothetical protein BGX27_011596 [Mortierella sp. AM989]
MVDNALKSGKEFDHKPHYIDTSLFSQGKSSMDHRRESMSPIFAFSPRTSSQVKADIPKVDDRVIFQLNQDSLLNLFPMPPPRVTSTSSTAPKSCLTEPSPPSPRLGDALQQSRPRKSSKNRNCVITSGLFLTPPTEDGQKSSLTEIPGVTRLMDVTLDWESMNSDGANHRLSISRHPLSPCSPMMHSGTNKESLESLTEASVIDACPTSPSVACPSSVSSPTSPRASMDALSQHLWNIETQMRRSSFLMSNRRVSVLSALFVSNAVTPVANKFDQERLYTELSLTVGPTTAPSKDVAIQKEPYVDDIKQPLKGALQELDWRAWHGAWTRRRVPPPSPVGSHIKDANPELWESEGLKWGDRFQLLVHNFQSSAGKHSKRLADILPMNRWSRRSRSRSTSITDKTQE